MMVDPKQSPSSWFALLFLLPLLLPTESVALETGASSEKPRPNVLLILADDIGWRDLSVVGNPIIETPNLDALARSGVRFTQAYTTSPVCTPSRASLLTGLHPARLGMTAGLVRAVSLDPGSAAPPKHRSAPYMKLVSPPTAKSLPQGRKTLGELFQTAGYSTAYFGKWHVGEGKHEPRDRGFEVYAADPAAPSPQSYFSPFGLTGIESDPPGTYLTDHLTDLALEFLNRPRQKPFLLVLASFAAHEPWQAPETLVEHYRKKTNRLPESVRVHPPYAAMVHQLDRNVGRLLTNLEKRGLTKETLVIFLSDNGATVRSKEGTPITNNAPLRGEKGNLFEGGIRIPLLISWPGRIEGGRNLDSPVSILDILPTLLEGLGDRRSHGELEGVSLWPWLTRGEKPAPRDLFWHFPHYSRSSAPVGAVRSGQFKLLEDFETGQTTLYDILNDPGETRDLSTTQPKIAGELLEKLSSFRRQVGARMPVPNPAFDPAVRERLRRQRDVKSPQKAGETGSRSKS